ncbi:hypothetical protein GobsT_32880 [Gemmata obscuriglobus]|uniref:Uncharacterized protein n=1 Tax=Gemmata obscuriglobus TaxID=114 RepID=A0A2Z3GVT8_9BACT|nr:hypothetical protein [Gemmata obscuriglobus]AWM38539.1 hypothetical protein C1280_17165 [Gemmata obscuriglobus]QEG28508.1 hypothetical protein GobsT_32880 [Gemmata obscuriglobus]VTS06556.1 signal peptide protein : Uncharacterized protein OS=Pirellula staleyi (strain ATCC 27377 / DSM 6068 / ICPB 4128) GN=Psta_3083 PE=4 SV=1 [Gemmata obscuriglobus UQM 2246]
MRCALWFVLTAALGGAVAGGDDKAPAKAKPPAPIVRLFVQDMKTCSVKWADVRVGADQELLLDPLADVAGFKKLDPAKQKLVQMRESGSLVCVGVRDDADGAFESGWVLMQSGVGYADHGDHGHWTYKAAPAVIDSRLDAKQGNPAHLYRYDGWFYLANDKLNGYTRIDPEGYATNDARSLGQGKPLFVTGGGGHITLAVVDNKVGYACWIDGGGPNKGRVDVSPVGIGARPEPAYSFALPTGGIHGAAACAGKVFFAPSAGVCWVDADPGLKLKADQVQVRHIDLGTEGDKPRRTGAFVTHGHHVLFVTGKEAPNLAVLDAKSAEPKPVFLPLAVKKGTHAVTPEVVTSVDGKTYALVFHDRVKDSDAADALEVIALDPNGDGDFSDMKSVKVLAVGRSAVEGHFGHHDLAFDANRKYGFFTNPGDGTLSVLSLKTLDVVATFTVGGTPAALVARGGEDHDD